MNRILFTAALAASFVAAPAAQAQAIPGAVVAVADIDRVTADCNACKTAVAALRSQAQAQQAREKALADPLAAEQKSIQTAIDALGGKEPDAALKTRVTQWQNRQQTAAAEVERARTQLQRNQQYIQQQVAAKLGPIYQQVMQRRGANILVDSNVTLATATNVDVTNDVLAALNAALPTIATTAPAQTQTTPQSR
jgi:Skp family chaperone for outer membrane proteins